MISRRFIIIRQPCAHANNFLLNNYSSLPIFISPVRYSSSSSSVINFIINEVKHRTPVGTWTPLGNIASCLSDEVQEAVADHGGLRKFLESTPEARHFFDISTNNNSSVVVISQKRILDPEAIFPDAPEPSAAAWEEYQQHDQKNSNKNYYYNRQHPNRKAWMEGYSYHNPNPRIFNNTYEVYPSHQHQNHQQSHHHNNRHHQRDESMMSPREYKKLVTEKSLLRNIPSFPVPLVEVVKLDLEEHEAKISSSVVTLQQCRDFLQKKIEPNGKHLVDLLFPFDSAVFEDVWEALLDTKNPNVQAIDDIRDYCFISILPPFVGSHLNSETDEIFSQTSRVADYDMCRLARYLSNDNFVTVSSIINSNIPSLLQKPVMHVIAAFPNHFEYIPPNGKLPADASFVCGVEESCKGAEEKGCPHVDLSSTPSSNENVSSDDHKVIITRDLGSIRFILAPAELEHGLGGVPEKIKRLDLQLLQELYKALCIRKADQPLPDASRFGLPKVPTGMARVKVKHQVIRSLIRIRFPRGNPFFDRNVFAHYIFDNLPETQALPVETFRERYLPEHGRTAAPLSAEFLQSFPHLYLAVQGTKNEWIVQRADAEQGKGRLEQKPLEEITEQEIIDSLWANMPVKYDFTIRTALSSVHNLMPMAHQNRIRTLGGLRAVFRRHPQQFIFDEETTEFFYWGEAPPNVLSRKTVQEMEKAKSIEMDVVKRLEADEKKKKKAEEETQRNNVTHIRLSAMDAVIDEEERLAAKMKK